MDITSTAYRDAFIRYLRKGTEIDLSYKAAEPNKGFYIWRTQGDDRVRTSHAANEGKIFAWDKPPPTGNPGEEHGCRCWAEPFKSKGDQYATQKRITIVDDALNRWDWLDFGWHFYFGNAEPVQLWEIGHFREILISIEQDHNIYNKVNQQIIDLVREKGEGDVPFDFSNSYYFGTVSYPHGSATVSGIFWGNAIREGNNWLIGGRMEYNFMDVFTDPVRLRDRVFGDTSDITAVPEWWRRVSDFDGTPFIISERWKNFVSIKAHVDPEESIFHN